MTAVLEVASRLRLYLSRSYLCSLDLILIRCLMVIELIYPLIKPELYMKPLVPLSKRLSWLLKRLGPCRTKVQGPEGIHHKSSAPTLSVYAT